VLLAASITTAALGRFVDTGVIFGVVLINALIGFIQEGKAEQALEAVRGLLAHRANARRVTHMGVAERLEIAASELVVGDIVLLSLGDRVPADLRLVRAKNLRTDEAALTGESMPVEKDLPLCSESAALADRTNMTFAGTVVAYGQGIGVVVAIGQHTELGRIGKLVASVGALATPLMRRLDQFGVRIMVVTLAVCALAFGIAIWLHASDPAEAFLAIVGIAVAAIPEGLPAVVTIALAIGTRRMAHQRAIVRRLPAVEALGSVTVICADKTGTLTRNEMTAVRVVLDARDVEVLGVGYAPNGGFESDGRSLLPEQEPALLEFARCALLCNDARLARRDESWVLAGDPTEGALVTLAAKAGLDAEQERKDWPRVDEVPFESEHRLMATLHRRHDGEPVIVHLKGAPERVFLRCTHWGRRSRADWEAFVDSAAHSGQRVLALATRPVARETASISLDDLTTGFRLLGLACLMDRPREEAIDAIAACQTGGIRVKKITGDHAATAVAVARQLGLAGSRALTGGDIDALQDDALRVELAHVDVIARATPEHKLRLVTLL
jgi:magnesium-transporting ATPase (P-type)